MTEDEATTLATAAYDGDGSALRQLEEAGSGGDVVAAFSVSAYYGLIGDSAKAWEWKTKAAELGDDEVQNNLGTAYYKGHGVTQDYEKAAYWYTRSAKQGNAASQFDLGVLYYLGKGVEKNLNAAIGGRAGLCASAAHVGANLRWW